MLQIQDTLRRAPVISPLALLALPLASSSALAAGGSCEARAVRSQEAMPVQALANWEPVDDRTVLIWLSHDTRAHLVRLNRAIPRLTTAAVILLVAGDHDRTISACGHDSVMVRGAGGGMARIVSIRYLSERRTAELDSGGATTIGPEATAI